MNIQLIILAFVVLDGLNDGFGYRKSQPNKKLTAKELKTFNRYWHAVGLTIYAASVFFAAKYLHQNLRIVSMWAILYRLAFFDLVHNIIGGISIQNFGTEAFSDNLGAFIFGANGLWKKCALFAIIILIINLFL